MQRSGQQGIQVFPGQPRGQNRGSGVWSDAQLAADSEPYMAKASSSSPSRRIDLQWLFINHADYSSNYTFTLRLMHERRGSTHAVASSIHTGTDGTGEQ